MHMSKFGRPPDTKIEHYYEQGGTNMSSIQVGKQAPDFELPAAAGTVRLSDYRGKVVVLYFYPKDMTPACTTQACDFRDRHDEFAHLDTVIIGISTDAITRHEKFADTYQLPFILLSDVDHTVAEQYGVWRLKKLYGREYLGIVRSTFVIGKDGVLLKEWRNVRVKNHVEEALSYIRTLQP